MKKLSMLFWLIPAILSPLILIRGIRALQQPWGGQSEKIGGLVFFFILWIVSLFFLFEKKLTEKLNVTPIEEEKRKLAFHAIGNAAFVLGGILIIIIRSEKLIIGGLSVFFLSMLLKRNQTISKDGSEMNERVDEKGFTPLSCARL